jgi:hypothetical protein
VGGSTSGGNTGIVDEGVGIGEGEGETETVGVGVGEGETETVGVGVGDAVSAAKSEFEGAINRSGRLTINPIRMSCRLRTGHWYTTLAFQAIIISAFENGFGDSQKALMGRTEFGIPLNLRY